MKKSTSFLSVLFAALFFMAARPAGAQDFEWARGIGGSGIDNAASIVLDKLGNVYVTGSFSGTVDFDPGQAGFNLVSNGDKDIFVAKYNADSTLAWVKGVGGFFEDYANSIAIDTSGNLYITGGFEGTVDFDPGTGIENYTSQGAKDIFILKLDRNGDFVWAKVIGGPGALGDIGGAIAISNFGDVYVTGAFEGTVDFDPGPGVFNLVGNAFPVPVTLDVFILKLDASGDFVWAKNTTGSGISLNEGTGISLDNEGNVYVSGTFVGLVDFDPGTANVSLSAGGSGDVFILKLNIAGDFVWVKSMGGPAADQPGAGGMVLDDAGNIYVTGRTTGTADFGQYNLTSEGSDIFICKLSISGDVVWAKNIGGPGNEGGQGIALDDSGYIYITGYFADTVDFDPGANNFDLVSNGGSDIFICKLNNSGDLVWAKGMGDTLSDVGNAIAVAANGAIYTAGTFRATVDFDPEGNGFNIESNGNADIFIHKIKGKCLVSSTISETACDSFVFKGKSYYSSGLYTDTFVVNTCDSIVLLDLTINKSPEALISLDGNTLTASDTGSYQWINCATNTIVPGATSQSYLVTDDGSYAVVITVNGCTDTSDCREVTINGIAGSGADKMVRIYPNPAHDRVHIAASAPVTVTLSSLEGRVVLLQKDVREIDLSGFADGVYLIRVSDAQGLPLKTEKLVKQNRR